MVSPSPVHVNADGELFELSEINIELIEKVLTLLNQINKLIIM